MQKETEADMIYHDILPARIDDLNRRKVLKKKFVLYWMQQSQRAECNHALEYAIREANALSVSLVVAFVLMDDYPEANARHYTFMLEGLREVQTTLQDREIRMVIQTGHPPEVVAAIAKDACFVVCDRGYLKHQRTWRRELAEKLTCRLVQVESDVIVPVEILSDKAEYAAYTIRPKFNRKKADFLVPLKETPVRKSSLSLTFPSVALDDIRGLIHSLKINTSVVPVSHLFQGGTSTAAARLEAFIRDRLPYYAQYRNQPDRDEISHMSMYLHFGQISPLYIALAVAEASPEWQESKDSYLEELSVRRELAINHVFYRDAYDQLSCVTGWAQQTLNAHRNDQRPYLYGLKTLESAETHDPYWNAAMNEMKHTGFMHGYMRMYWAKKILEWMASPEEAFQTTLMLNNKYFIDGRDPNSYTGVGWTYGLHDRAWKERPVFGKIRYMAASGLERKYDINAYITKVAQLIQVT
jgi:deoxyribodipyrimidine photo-lyase